MEKTILGNVAQDAGAAGSARLLGSIQSWLGTNFVTMTDGVAPVGSNGTAARTEGATASAFTEAKLKEVVKSCFENGGNPTLLVVPPTQKQVVSTFTGIAEQRYQAPAAKATTIIGAADVYLSDFGTLSVVPDRFMTADTTPDAEQALVLDPTMDRTQIQGKTVHISGTLDAVDKAGRKTETAYQLAKAGQELKRDMEKTILGNVAASNGTAGSAARLLGSIQSWLGTNFVTMTDGVAPVNANGTAARTEGATASAFTEDKLKDVVKSCFENGGNPTLLVVPPTQKQVVSTFAGIAAQRYEAPAAKATTIIGAADVYLSDFGTLSVVPDRFMTADTTPDAEQALVLDPTMASVATLRPFESNLLAKTGDSEKHQMLVEYTLQVSNEKAHGIVADLAV